MSSNVGIADLREFQNLLEDYLRKLNKYTNFSDYMIFFPIVRSNTYYPGAYVQNPVKGDVDFSDEENFESDAVIFKGIMDEDASSLYPTIIYSNNVGIETAEYVIPEMIGIFLITYQVRVVLEFLKCSKFEKLIEILEVLDYYKKTRNKEQVKEKYPEFGEEVLQEWINYLVELLKNLNDLVVEFESQRFQTNILRFLEEYIRDKGAIIVFHVPTQSFKVYKSAKKFLRKIYVEEILKKKRILNPFFIFKRPDELESYIRKLVKIPIKFRNEVKAVLKKLKESPEDEEAVKQIIALNLIQLTYKLIANSLYGYLGYVKSLLFNNVLASAITIEGRMMIKTITYVVSAVLLYLEQEVAINAKK